MPKTTFARKPYNLADVERDTAAIRAKHTRDGERKDQEDYYIAEEIELDGEEWCNLTACLPKNRDWLKAFSDKEHPNDGGGVPCIRVTSSCSDKALLIDTSGYSYARYVGIEDAAPASFQIEQPQITLIEGHSTEQPRIRVNEETSMDPRLVTEIQERLDQMSDPEYTWQGKRWLDGMICALSALTGQIWECKRIDNKRCHANLYYLENEDGTERIIPSFLTF